MIVYSSPVAVPLPTSTYWVHGSGYGVSPQQGAPLYYSPSASPEMISSPPPQANWNLQPSQQGLPLYYSPNASPEMISASPPQANWNLQPQLLYPQFWSPAPVQYGDGDAAVDSLEYQPEGYNNGLSSSLPPVNYVFVPIQPQYENQVFTLPPLAAPSAPEFEEAWAKPNSTASSDSDSSRGLSVMAQPFQPGYGLPASNNEALESTSRWTAEVIEASKKIVTVRLARPKGTGIKQEVFCTFCKKNGETREFYLSHNLKNHDHSVQCPVLRKHRCPLCAAEGDNAHTLKYCPVNGGQVVTPVGSSVGLKKRRRNSSGLITKLPLKS